MSSGDGSSIRQSLTRSEEIVHSQTIIVTDGLQIIHSCQAQRFVPFSSKLLYFQGIGGIDSRDARSWQKARKRCR